MENNQPQDNLKGRIEAFLLASDGPLSIGAIKEGLPEVPEVDVERAINALEDEYNQPHRGIHIERVAGGLQLRTNTDFKDDILTLFESQPVRLSKAARETLAIIAYQQPITRAEIEDIRGVNSSAMVRKLVDYELAEKVGQLDDLGRPHLYGTTPYFLEAFGLESLDQLPALDDEEIEKMEQMYQDKVE